MKNIIPKIPFGAVVRQIRQQSGMKLEDVVKKTGTSVSFMSSLETGKSKPPKGFEEKLIAAFRLDPSGCDAFALRTSAALFNGRIFFDGMDEEKKNLLVRLACSNADEQVFKQVMNILNRT